ncbi:MAG: hypothetical protein IIB13_05205 [Chloroflexi bacterium]|nr:hypothetical protein [Chloroflexota bacterium]
MRRYKIFLITALVFISLSGLIYFIHYLVFRDIHHIFIYMVGDLAFVPLEVFLVVIVIERILNRREKQTIRHKLNMVIGSFYSEVGTKLLQKLRHCFIDSDEIRRQLTVNQTWTNGDFKEAAAFAVSLKSKPPCLETELEDLKSFFFERRIFLLRLLENPSLLEHESFTDLLWATFHVVEELEARPSVNNLPALDLAHITVDINRMYGRLVAEWVAYVKHLKADYPFLFSLVVRTHPFQAHPSATVVE